MCGERRIKLPLPFITRFPSPSLPHQHGQQGGAVPLTQLLQRSFSHHPQGPNAGDGRHIFCQLHLRPLPPGSGERCLPGGSVAAASWRRWSSTLSPKVRRRRRHRWRFQRQRHGVVVVFPATPAGEIAASPALEARVEALAAGCLGGGEIPFAASVAAEVAEVSMALAVMKG